MKLCICFLVVFGVRSSSAAIVAVGDLVTSANSVSNGADKDADPDIDQRDILSGTGADLGEVISGVFTDSLVTTGPTPDDFLVTADRIAASVSQSVVDRGMVEVGASFSYQVNFEVEPGETGVLDLNFKYGLANLGISETVELAWGLSGPDANVGTFSGSVSLADSGTDFSAGNSQSDALSAAGFYTFVIKGAVPLTEIGGVRTTQSASAAVGAFSLEFTSVPEPSASLLLGLGGLVFLNRRKRS